MKNLVFAISTFICFHMVNAQVPLSALASASETIACPGDTITLNSGISGGSGDFSIVWSGNGNFFSPNSSLTDVILPSGNNIQTYTVTVIDNIENTTVTSSVNITVRGITVDLGNDTTINCGDSILISANVTGYISGAQFTWNNGAGTFQIYSQGPSVETVTVTNSNGCTATDSKLIGLTTNQTVSFIATSFYNGSSNDTLLNQNRVCSGVSVLFENISADTTSAWLFEWNYGDQTGSVGVNGSKTYSSTGTYTVTLIATNGSGCLLTSAPLQVHVLSPSNPLCTGGGLTVALGASQTVCSGTSISLYPTISGGTLPYSYQWSSNGNNLSCSSCNNPTVSLTQNSTYNVTVTDAVGNTGIGSINYFVINCNGACTPNTSTPIGSLNPDGINFPVVAPSVNYNQTITFRNFDSLTLGGIRTRVDHLYIDSITNLPCGLGWATSQTDNKFLNKEFGCIYLNGMTNDAVGQYNLKVFVRVKVSLLPSPVPFEMNNLGLFTALRVCNTGGNCPAVNIALTGSTSTCNTGQVTPPVNLSVNLGADQLLCAGNTTVINPIIQGGTAPYTYSWISNGNPLSCYNCASPSITVTTATQIILQVTDANSLTDFDTVLYSPALPSATPTILGNTNISPQTPYSYSVTAVSGAQYVWSVTNGTIVSGQGTNSISVVWFSNGPYTLQLTLSDGSGCITSASLAVNNSGGCNIPVNVTTVSSNPICTGDTILLIVSAAAGTSYQWLKNGSNITGATDDTLKVTATGTYQVQVSNGSCAIVSSGYIFTFEPSPVTPVILGSANVTGCSQQPVNLTVNNTYTSYLWSNGATTAAITITTSGNYVVTVTALNGCKAVSAPVAINQSLAAAPAICAVSVDAASGGNMVVWEKLNTAAVDSYYIYKESNQFNVFYKIGAKGVNEFSTFVDVNANPAQQADRYSIAILDTCGNLTVQSAPHKTIHLTINQGLGGVWNLIWNHYEGFTFGSYNIYRGTTSGNLVQIATISSGNSSYTDLSPPINTLFYQIEAVNPVGCTPTAKQSGYASSLSNIVSTDPNGIAETDVFLRIALYPNPTQGNFMLDIQSTNQLNAFVYVTDVIGTEVINKRIILAAGKNTIEMGLGEFTNGLYLVRLLDANGNSLGSYKIVKH